MTEQELQQERRERWRLAGNAIRTLDDARAFLEAVGFSLMYPVRPAISAPTFIGAYVGAEDNLPTINQAFSDSRAQEAMELMVRLLREQGAYEANLFGETSFLLSPAVFPFFYALMGDKNPKQPPKLIGRAKASHLAIDTFKALQEHGPQSENNLRQRLGGALSAVAMDRALGELWSALRITRVDYSPEQGATWDLLYRWSPEVVRLGLSYSAPEALSALISKYLECMIAVEPEEIENFFSHMTSRSKVREVVKALTGAREFSFVSIGEKTLLQMSPQVVRMPDPSRSQPIHRRSPTRKPNHG